MRYSVSDTAEHGDYTGGPRIVTAETKAEMKKMLDEIRSGQVREGLDRGERDRPHVVRSSGGARSAPHRIEKVGAELRALMPFLKPVTITGRGDGRRRRPAEWLRPPHRSPTRATHARESRRLSTLLEVSQALSGTLNLRSALHRVLEILAKHHGTVRSLVDAAARERRAARRGLGRPRRAVARGPLPRRRGHHRQGRREQPADRRAARQQGADVPQPRVASGRSCRKRS